MSHSTHPTSIQMFSDRTTEMAKREINSVAWNYSFLCPVCKEKRPTKGRVSRGYKRGFRCAVCESKRKESK